MSDESRPPADVQCFVGIGSNIEPATHIPAALGVLHGAAGTRLTGISTFYRTQPVGTAGGPEFTNGVIALRTSLSLPDLATLLGDVEARCGRRPSPDRHAPRTIDLDLLLYGDRESTGAGVVLPHPDIAVRAYVALPLLELAPDLVLAGDGRSVRDLAAAFDRPPGEPLPEFSEELRALIRS